MKSNYKSIGELVERIDERNRGGFVTTLIGVSIDKKFIPSVANVIGTDLTNYKVIRKYDFAVSLMQVSRDEKIPVACQKDYDAAIMSPAYPIFRVKDTSVILPEYLEMWFMRSEFDREASFVAVGGVRGSMPWEEFTKLQLPVPSMDEQIEIVNSYKTITDRIALKKQINDNLAATAATLFQQMFLYSPAKKLWPVRSFSHFISSTVGGDWGQEKSIGNYTQEVSCIRGTDIPLLNAGSISSAPTRYILPGNFLAKKIKADDLVVEISGGSPVQATGRIALVPQQVLDYRGDKLICSNFCRIVTVNKTYLQYFLQYWLYLYRAGRMFDYENSSTGLKNFDFSSFVEKEPISIPPEGLVKSYNKMISSLYRQLFNNGFEIETLNETQQHILPQIMLHGF